MPQAARTFLFLLTAAARAQSPPIELSPPPAYYPRLLTGTPALGVVESPNATHRRLVLLARAATSADAPWAATGAVVAAASAANATDLGNGFLLRLNNAAILCAYRHHDGSDNARVYRIQVVSSSDSGATWGAAVTVTSGPVGLWEPFLLQGAGGAVHIFYSAELTNGGEQDVVRQSSLDGGRSWGSVDARIHTAQSRNGMPGVSVLSDSSLFAVFEGFWSASGWGHFTVNSARSFDGGNSWTQRAIIHAPSNSSQNAGSPQVATCVDGRVAVIFMTSETPGNAFAWPDGAHLAVSVATLNPDNASAPLVFSAPAALPSSSQSFWPSLFSDNAAAGAIRPAWQSAEGAAELSGAVC